MMDFGFSLGSESESGKSTTTGSKKTTDKLNISDAGTQKIIEDLLAGSGGTGGLASIFAGEQSSGIFNSSVAAQEAGKFAAQIVGEIAKLTAERETTEDVQSTTKEKGTVNSAGVNANVSLSDSSKG